MSSDRNAQDDSKKKAKLIGVVIVIAIVIWQAMGVFGGGSTTPAPVTPPAAGQAVAKAPAGAPNASAPGAVSAEAMKPEPRQSSLQSDDLLKSQKEKEVQYIQALNDLQMLRIQRDIAETNQAIAKAKLETVTAEKSISEFLTVKPVVVSENSYANMLAGGDTKDSQNASAPKPRPAPVAAAPVSSPSAPYVVLSVSQQGDKWSAVLGNGGKLYSVTTGDVMTVDGSLIASINREGVVLKKDGKEKKININTPI